MTKKSFIKFEYKTLLSLSTFSLTFVKQFIIRFQMTTDFQTKRNADGEVPNFQRDSQLRNSYSISHNFLPDIHNH